MELLILGGLGLAGLQINQNVNDETYKRNKKKLLYDNNEINRISSITNSQNKNVYENSFYNYVENKNSEKADVLYQKARLPVEYGGVENYNKIPIQVGPFRRSENYNNGNPYVDVSSSYIKNDLREGFLNSSTIPVENNNVENYELNPSSLATSDLNNLENQKSITLWDHNTNDYHNNMMPFFGSNVKQNMDINANMPILDRYTGTNEFKLGKKEIEPFFTPSVNTQNVFGDVTYIQNLDDAKKRFIPSQYLQKQTPIEQIAVGPGLNLSPDIMARDGFQEYVRILPPTTNQLRVKTKPKISSEGRVVKGNFYVTKQELPQELYKNRPVLLVENFNGERNFVTTGAEIKPKMNERYFIKPTGRQKYAEIVGTAFASGSQKAMYRSAIRRSRKANFKNTWAAPPKTEVAKLSTQNQQLSYYAKQTERQNYESNNPITNLVSEIKKITSYYFDNAKTTTKETTLDEYKHSNISNVNRGAVVFNPKSIAKPTIKETTLESYQNSNVSNVNRGAVVYNPNSIAKITINETTLSEVDRSNISNTNRGNVVYNPESIAKTTINETTLTEVDKSNISNTNRGNVVYNVDSIAKTTINETTLSEVDRSNISNINRGNVVYNPESIAKTTINETTITNVDNSNLSNTNRGNVVYNPESIAKTTINETTLSEVDRSNLSYTNRGNVVYNPDSIAKTTINETTIQEVENSNLSYTNRGNVVYNPDSVAKTTNKETTLLENYKGIYTNESAQDGAYKVTGVKPRYTSRQDIAKSKKNSYGGIAGYNVPQPVSNEAEQNMTTNALKEKIARGRAPTTEGVKVVPDCDKQGLLTTFRNSDLSTFKNIEPTLREKYDFYFSNNDTPNKESIFDIGDKTRKIDTTTTMNIGVVTKDKNVTLTQENYIERQIEPDILDAYRQNPYTKSLHSWT